MAKSVITLRPYQDDLLTRIYAAWASGARNVCAVLPTGGGKTVLFCEILRRHKGRSIAIAHRQELVAQMSLALARDGVRHRILAPSLVIRNIVALHMIELGVSYYCPSASCTVAGVNTLVRRKADPSVTLWITDECQHLLTKNQWGKAVAAYPNARGLGVTATPMRADGNGLGRHADGVLDVLVEGPGMRDLITAGYLTDYTIYAPRSDVALDTVPVGASGDFQVAPLREAVHKSHIVGDVVQHYLRIAPGKLGITFAVDVASAVELCRAYVQAGIAAQVVSADTPDLVRASIMSKVRTRQILQLVNVDIFGEGFDLPAIEVVSMARPTASYVLYAQQFGRGCRLLEGKPRAIIIDHVGNVMRHGLPDAPRVWTLDRRERRVKGDAERVLLIRVCPQCTQVYERFRILCPHCGHIPAPSPRSTPALVDGDLQELTPETLAALRAEIHRVDGPVRIPQHLPSIAQRAIANRHKARQDAQRTLRDVMMLWGGERLSQGDHLREAQRRFYLTYGVDVATAQTLNEADAMALRDRIRSGTL